MVATPIKTQHSLPRKFLVGVVAGSGFVARAATEGGADFVLALPAGRMRNMGTASIACMLPIADADRLTQGFAAGEVLPATHLPVLLGTSSFGGAPDAEALLARGFAGAVNFPSAMHYGPAMQDALEAAGIGFSAEVARLAAVQARGGVAMLYCGTREQALAGARAGIAHLLFNYGWNAGGGHGARMTLHEAAQIAHDVTRAVRRVSPGIRVLLEGGPIVDADDLGFVLRAAEIDGYIGGSTIERMPLERSVANRIAAYRMARHMPEASDAERDRVLRFGVRNGFAGSSEALAAFLARLRALAPGRDDLFLETEDGADVEPALKAVCDAMGIARQTSRVFEARPAHTPDDLPERAALVVARDPAALDPAVQVALMRHEGRVLWIMRSLDTGLAAFPGLDAAVAAHIAPRRLALPRMRERGDDIEAMWTSVCDRRLGARRDRAALSPSALLTLRGHDWPGGEAEFARVAVELAQPGVAVIEGADVARVLGAAGEERPAEALDQRSQILQALHRNGYRKGRTAQALGVSRKTLYNRMRRFGISG